MSTSSKLEIKIIELIDIFKNNSFDEVIEKATILFKENQTISILPNLIGASYAAKKEHERAIIYFKNAIEIDPNNFEIFNNVGKSQIALGLLDKAIKTFNHSIKLNQIHYDSYFNLGIIYYNLESYIKSLEYYSKAIELNNNVDKIYYNSGIVLSKIGKNNEAIKFFLDTLKINNKHIKALNNLAILYINENKYDLAIHYLKQAIGFQPNHANSFNNLGAVYFQKKDYKLAYEYFEKAFELNNNLLVSGIQKFFLKRFFCDWSNDQELNMILKKTVVADDNVPPWFCLSLEDNIENHFIRAKKFTKKFKLLNHNNTIYNNDKIRIGYYAADFHQHAGMINMEGIFKNHNKNKFEIYAFYYGDIKKDSTHERIRKYFDKFYYVDTFNDEEILKLSMDCRIDIAIYRAGLTINSRSSIFAKKVAPIQINYLGYPGTTGQEGVDYIISDKFVIPDDQEKYYSENIIFLTECYYPRDNNRKISSKKFSRKNYRIADNCFVFCSFNNSYKITKEEFNIWMKLLKEVKNSKLLLLASDKIIKSNLLKEAKKYNIFEDRLVFLENIIFEEHLARHSLADLFLDSFNYNAHTSAVDALWSGLPILTKSGNSFSSRICGSLLKYIKLDEMVTKSNEEYFAKAIELATQPIKYKEIKDKIMKLKISDDFFDTKKYTSNLEKAYERVHKLRINNNKFENIYIKN